MKKLFIVLASLYSCSKEPVEQQKPKETSTTDSINVKYVVQSSCDSLHVDYYLRLNGVLVFQKDTVNGSWVNESKSYINKHGKLTYRLTVETAKGSGGWSEDSILTEIWVNDTLRIAETNTGYSDILFQY